MRGRPNQHSTKSSEFCPDLRVGPCVDDVAAGHQTQADAEAGALNCCDHRYRDSLDCAEDRVDLVGQHRSGVVGGGIDAGDVAPRAERPTLAAEQDRPNFGAPPRSSNTERSTDSAASSSAFNLSGRFSTTSAMAPSVPTCTSLLAVLTRAIASRPG